MNPTAHRFVFNPACNCLGVRAVAETARSVGNGRSIGRKPKGRVSPRNDGNLIARSIYESNRPLAHVSYAQAAINLIAFGNTIQMASLASTNAVASNFDGNTVIAIAGKDFKTSTVQASGNVNISASGAGKDSALAVQGSSVLAGNAVTLQADGDINLLAAQNTQEQHSTDKSSSASVGIGFALGGGQARPMAAMTSPGAKRASRRASRHRPTILVPQRPTIQP